MLYKKLFILALFACCIQHTAKSQIQAGQPISKPVIDSNAFGKWGYLSCKVSNDAQYAVYSVWDNNEIILTLKQVSSSKELKIAGTRTGSEVFTNDNKRLIFVQGRDSLCLIELATFGKKYIPNVQSFSTDQVGEDEWLTYQSVLPDGEVHIINLHNAKELSLTYIVRYQVALVGNVIWIAYQTKSEASDLHVIDPKSRKKYDFVNVSSWFFSPDKTIMLAQQTNGKMQWIDLANGKVKEIVDQIEEDKDAKTGNYTFDHTGKNLVFTSTGDHGENLWYFKEGTKKAISISLDGLPKKGNISDIKFNRDATIVLIRVRTSQISTYENVLNGAHVKLWDYKDGQLPVGRMQPVDQWFSLNLNSKRLTKLNEPDETIYSAKNFNNYVLANMPVAIDYFYNPNHIPGNCLIDIRTGSRTAIPYGGGLGISPDEKYVTWFDGESLNWFTYEIATEVKRNISRSVSTELCDDYLLQIGRPKMGSCFGIAAWSISDDRLYLYDKYDIWEVDPQGLKSPVCITKGLGAKEKFTLNITRTDVSQDISVIDPKQPILITAFDPYTKNAGIWKLRLGRNPVRGPMLPYALGDGRREKGGDLAGPASGEITKVGNTDQYLVTKESAETYRNYFLTSDFKNFKQLSDFQPQKAYNWLTADLIHWKLPDGTENTGILYKPENFDPEKKYPVIFTYYQGESNRFYSFPVPDYSGGRIDIPEYVSNGYLVFYPDIFNKKGQHGQNVVDAVVSAAKYLSKCPYVDSTKFGLQGHSFGGWETNYLVTHTEHLFTAACSADGMSDLISVYDGMNNGKVNYDYYEHEGQYSPFGVGITPWINLQEFANGSPVISADKATTPLLIFHGAKDDFVPFGQGLEMFFALKRSGKKVWLVEYPNAGHCPEDGDSKDMTIRMRQFFDYYLKDASPPKWMTHPVAASGRQEKVGYERDQTSVQP